MARLEELDGTLIVMGNDVTTVRMDHRQELSEHLLFVEIDGTTWEKPPGFADFEEVERYA